MSEDGFYEKALELTGYAVAIEKAKNYLGSERLQISIKRLEISIQAYKNLKMIIVNNHLVVNKNPDTGHIFEQVENVFKMYLKLWKI